EATPHRSTPTVVLPAPGLGSDERGRVAGVVDGLRVWLPSTLVAEASQLPATVELSAVRPALSPGFFLVDGPSGRRHQAPLARVYVHLRRPEDAAPVWHRVLTRLNESGVVYRAKIASAPRFFPRQDALVVYLGRGSWDAAVQIRDVVQDLGARVGDTSSIFTHVLAPGVSLAWEPADSRPGYEGLSFGEHRCKAVAEALVAVATGTAPSVDEALRDTMTAAAIDPECPARNHDSPGLPDIGLGGPVPGPKG
ncbi:T3SS effector HopA1 family protein, partial [Staphylococcus capitis]|uniref:T3SS effector HopA1 family protein n=1 Tax=Staphylococcus capitis TaxID=29388 RepID=UPI003CFD1BE3